MALNKSEYIERYGEEEYERRLETKRVWCEANRKSRCASAKKWRKKHPENQKAVEHEKGRKGGKYYKHMLEYNRTGLQGARRRIRSKHAKQYRPLKEIIAPDSEIHHEWKLDSSEYTGVALVESNPHRYGIIDVIRILDGKITLLTEKDIKEAY
jgi:hypothetical protein